MLPREGRSLTAIRALAFLAILGVLSPVCPGGETGKQDPYPAACPPPVTLVERGRPRSAILATAQRSAIETYAAYQPCLEPFGWRWTTLVAPEIFTPSTLEAMEETLGRAERAAQADAVRRRVAGNRLLLDLTKRVMHYLMTIQAPFRSVDPRNDQALAIAREKAIALGEPLSRDLKRFCKQHGLEAYERLVDVHRDVRFLIDLPDRKPILQ